MDRTHGEVVQRLIAHDPRRAQNWVNWHRGMLRDPATLDGLLRPYVAEQEADDLADRIGGQPLDLAGQHAAIDAATDPAIAAQAKQRLAQKTEAERRAREAEAKAVSDRSWAKLLDPEAKSLRVIAPADYARLAPEEQAAISEAVAANRRGGDPAPNPALLQALADKARQGRLGIADVRRAWGKLPRRDWQAVDGWQRGGWRDAPDDAAKPAVLNTGPIALTPDMKARRHAALAAWSGQGIAAAQGALHRDPGPPSADPQKAADTWISYGALSTRSAGPGETPTPFTTYFKGIAEQQPELAPDLPGYAQRAIEKLGGVDPFTRQIQDELSGSFFDTGIDKTTAILQIREFGKARDPATGKLQCPDCAAVGDKLLKYLSDYNAEHPVEADMVIGGRFSTGALGTVTEPFYRGAGNLILGSINDANGDANRIGDFSLHNLYDPAAAIGKYSLRTLAGQTDIGADALSLAKRTGRAIADKYHDTKDIYDEYGASMALDARAQELGGAAGTIASMLTGYGEYRAARKLRDLADDAGNAVARAPHPTEPVSPAGPLRQKGDEIADIEGEALPASARADEPLRLTYTPTTNTLARVRQLPFPDRGPAGEQYVQELYESAGSQHFTVPPGSIDGEVITGTGGRYVDAPVSTPDGGTLTIEVKTYSRWRTIDGPRVQQFVPLSRGQTTDPK